MKKENRELDDYVHLRHVAQNGENYFLTILDDAGLQTINLSTFGKNKISFGSSFNNDIAISSNSVDDHQGYLEITEYGVLISNDSLQVPMIGNGNQIIDDVYLSEGSFVKIIDKTSQKGIVMIMSINKNLDEWDSYTLTPGNISIGSSGTCNIVLSPAGIAKHHATIHRILNKTTISDEGSLNGIYINGQMVPPSQQATLNNLDVIFIGNTKLILYENKLLYQIFEKGIQLDAIDIVKKVKIKFKTREISSHVSMSIKPSEFVALVGGSGAGKSTFMKCISGVTPPTSGTVLLNGENLYDNYENLKYNIGYVPQDDIVFSNLTLHDTLQYAAKLRMPDNTSIKERNQRIKEVLDIVSLSDFENSYIRQLSGGQRKRASIAVELLADPNLFFLDEPTSGLDPGTERSIMKTLREMSQMGKTIILVTHNTLNLHLCDKVAFFGDGGHLCFYGSPQEALEFFGVDDFVDIYTLISEDRNYWQNKFESTREKIEPKTVPEGKSNNIENKKKSFIKQLMILIRRYVKLISNDVQQLFILFAQAPIVAILLSLVTNNKLYISNEDTKAILFSLGCASIWLGLLNSVQEICKEKVILQKEYMADLKLSAYLLSKFIVQGILAFIQSFLLVFIFQSIAGKSPYSILIGSFWDVQLICFLSILASATTGLLISSIVKNANIAMIILPLILVPHLLFSGMLFKLEGATKFISNFVLCRWTVEGLGTSANLNALPHMIEDLNLNDLSKMAPASSNIKSLEPETFFTFTQDHMLQVIGVIILMVFVSLIASYIYLRKTINKNI